MNEVLKVLLSLSISGTLLVLILFFSRPLFKNKISKAWQYYIWLVVIARFFLPFAPETNLMRNVFQQIDKVIPQLEMAEAPGQNVLYLTNYGENQNPVTSQSNDENETELKSVDPIMLTILDKVAQNVWLIWLFVAALLLIRKITVYQSFVKYIKAGRVEVADIKHWEYLGKLVELMGIKKAVSLYTNPLISSPLLIGFFKPCIILPTTKLSDGDFEHTILHELTHFKRRDMFYKWLVQFTICVHWFNPAVRFMGSEISKACELSCDESVIKELSETDKHAYGDTLIEAMKTGGEYENPLASVTLTNSIELLKERLDAIMNFRKKTKWGICVSLLLTVVLACGFTFSGAYAASNVNPKVKPSPDIEAGGTINGRSIYFVYSEKGLRSIGTGDNGLDEFYMLAKDIDLSSDEWVPIGTADKPFTGTFNGNGSYIKGITMTDPNAKVAGLFGYAQGATLHNIELRDVDITSVGKNVAKKKVDPICAAPTNVTLTDNRVYPKVKVKPYEETVMKTFKFNGKPYYYVKNETQLRSIGQGKYSLDKNYVQACDIQMSTAEWKPIGSAENPFTGTFNGNGCEIKGLTMTDPNAKVAGLFGFADGATICNITMRDYDIAAAGKNVKGKSVAPILAIGIGTTKCYDNKVHSKK